jgi:Kef-type K+ transport system membrane component KefB
MDDGPTVVGDVAFALARAGLLALLIVVVGARVVPRLLVFVARLRDSELFTLAAVAIALGIAYVSYSVFGVSLALGAFLAGAVVSESDTSHQVAADAQPLREVFSVLFVVSVGMLFDPGQLLTSIPAVVGIILIVMAAKPMAAFAVVTLLRRAAAVALTVAAASPRSASSPSSWRHRRSPSGSFRGRDPAGRQRHRLDRVEPAPLRRHRPGCPRSDREPAPVGAARVACGSAHDALWP